jgi:hypothetical protein
LTNIGLPSVVVRTSDGICPCNTAIYGRKLSVADSGFIARRTSWSPQSITGCRILRPEDYVICLGEKPADAEALSAACKPIPAPISTRVNSPRNDDAEIVKELA